MRSSSISQAIMDLLEEQKMHLTASDIYDAIREKFSAVNRSTIYRALKRLVDEGEVSISDMGGGSQVYERYSDAPHHHLICQSCGKTFNLEDEVVQKFFREVETGKDFKIHTTHLILYGICSQCQQ